jgi:NADH-quinone oxidoreductase subunit G
MSEDLVNIEVDGVPIQARKGQMIIEVTDAHEVYVPRFCYHPKLSIAANCRMCLVEVERAPKPLPACATPVMEGMKVYTRSPRAIAAQKATMEFLLINHPLDCPICDQGGECELQDLAMGYGSDVSRFTERKRIVKDKNLGPLVATDMTRCIHCTRCVRFGQEIAGHPGTRHHGPRRAHRDRHLHRAQRRPRAVGQHHRCLPGRRAEQQALSLPRARLGDDPARDRVAARLQRRAALYAHAARQGDAQRAARCEEINETWAADRDRYGCHGLYAEDRLEHPMLRGDGRRMARSLLGGRAGAHRRGAAGGHPDRSAGFLAAPGATLEEHTCSQARARAGQRNIDHRLRRTDFPTSSTTRCCPASACRSPRSTNCRRCWWSARRCGARRPSWRIACAPRRCVARRSDSSTRRHSSGVPGGGRDRRCRSASQAEALAGVLAAACDGGFRGLPAALA